jgi:hypothetical protein
MLREVVLELMQTLPLKLQDQMKDKLAQYIKNYDRSAGNDDNKTEEESA